MSFIHSTSPRRCVLHMDIPPMSTSLNHQPRSTGTTMDSILEQITRVPIIMDQSMASTKRTLIHPAQSQLCIGKIATVAFMKYFPSRASIRMKTTSFFPSGQLSETMHIKPTPTLIKGLKSPSASTAAVQALTRESVVVNIKKQTSPCASVTLIRECQNAHTHR